MMLLFKSCSVYDLPIKYQTNYKFVMPLTKPNLAVVSLFPGFLRSYPDIWIRQPNHSVLLKY